MDKRTKAVEIILTRGVRIIHEHFRPDCCIAATRIAMDVLAPCGFHVAPLPVQVILVNKVGVDAINTHGWPNGEEQIREFQQKYGYWSIGLGYDWPGSVGWPGHLVALLNGDHILDLTLSQAHRPQHQIEPHPICTFAEQSFLNGQRRLQVSFDTCWAFYSLHDHDGYRRSKDWTDKRRRAAVVAEILDEIKRADAA